MSRTQPTPEPGRPWLRHFMPHSALVAASWALALLVLPHLPDPAPIHWNIAGEPDGFASRTAAALMLPLTMTLLAALLIWLPRLDPRRSHYPLFLRPYQLLTAAILGFMLVVQVTTTLSQLGLNVPLTVVLGAGLGLLFVLVGLTLPRLRSNWFAGIRTPWTLSSERVWDSTHRVGGRGFVTLGLLCMLLAPIAPAAGLWTLIIGAGVLALALTAYSYALWAREPQDR